MKQLFLIIIILISAICFCQTKPIPHPDTVNIVKGSIYVTDLFKNDIGSNKIVTSFKVRTTTYKPGKKATVTGIGTLTIDSNGLAKFTSVSTYLGSWPAISYTENNGLPGYGTTAKIIAKAIKQKDTFKITTDGGCHYAFYKGFYIQEVIIEYGQTVSSGSLKTDLLSDGRRIYYILFNNGKVFMISDTIYNILK